MQQASPLTSLVLFHLGPIPITRPVVTTWVIMLVITAACWLVTRRLRPRPDGRRGCLEIVVTGIAQQIEDIIRKDPRPFLPLLGTLFIFFATANLSGILPGVEAPTGKIGDARGSCTHCVLLGALLRCAGARISRLSRKLRRTETHHAASQYPVRDNADLLAYAAPLRQCHAVSS